MTIRQIASLPHIIAGSEDSLRIDLASYFTWDTGDVLRIGTRVQDTFFPVIGDTLFQDADEDEQPDGVTPAFYATSTNVAVRTGSIITCLLYTSPSPRD